MDNFLKSSLDFFLLPDDVKQKFQKNFELMHGYVLRSKASHKFRESFDITGLSDDLVFPDEFVPQFRQAAQDLAPKLCQLSHLLLKCMAVALGRSVNYQN